MAPILYIYGCQSEETRITQTRLSMDWEYVHYVVTSSFCVHPQDFIYDSINSNYTTRPSHYTKLSNQIRDTTYTTNWNYHDPRLEVGKIQKLYSHWSQQDMNYQDRDTMAIMWREPEEKGNGKH